MISEALFSSRSEEWETPPDLFRRLNDEFRFTLDVCATAENAKCSKFFTKKENGLLQSWRGERCWMNPPYGKSIHYWMRKAKWEYIRNGTLVVALVPARTDTAWFHDHVYGVAILRFIRGRIKFIPPDKKRASRLEPNPFPSLLAIYRGEEAK